MDSSRPRPDALLHDVRVLSLGAFVAGNICALMLAELGADVVKVEARENPEALRSYASPHQSDLVEPSGTPTTALFAGLTRSVRSVSVDLRTSRGRHLFRALAGRADVVMENLGPGKLESWECSYDDLRRRNPRLVMVSISGYGRSGPLAGFRAYASNINNYLGLTDAWALDGTHFDFVAGMHAANAVLAGLSQVAAGVPGVFFDVAQSETGAAIMAPLYLDVLANGRNWSAGPNEVPGAWLSGVFTCRGVDQWLALELEDADDWDGLCRYLDRGDLMANGAGVTPDRQDQLRHVIESWARDLTPLQAAKKLQGIGLAAGPIQDSEDLWRDPQHRSRESIVEVNHPDIGSVEYPIAPSRLSRTPGGVKFRGPRLGEHTTTVIAEWLGYGEHEVADLRRLGAIWQPNEE